MTEPRLVKRVDELSVLPSDLAEAIRRYIDRTVAERIAELRAEDVRADRNLEHALMGAAAALKRKHKMQG